MPRRLVWRGAQAAASAADGKTGSSDLSHFFNTPVLEHGDYRFFGTVSASKASCSPGGTKKGQIGFYPNQYLANNLFFGSLEVLVIFH